jgi:hypothetical protein
MQTMQVMTIIIGGIAVLVIALLGAVVLWKMFSGDIDLRGLISDADGTASMSRFQLLIFTFIIGLTFLYLVMAAGADRLPDIPSSVLTLLGISGTSYLVSKSIDHGRGKKPPPARDDVRVEEESRVEVHRTATGAPGHGSQPQ